MQFCQLPFQPTGFPNNGQPCGFNAPMPNQINGYPDIIGEGNVASIISPDGSTQLLFFPTLQWPQWRTFPQNPYVGNLNNPYINTLGAWFVRNIFNPMQPMVFPQPRQDCFALQYPIATASDCCLNLSSPGLSLKFHNDTCTSTSDINYFVPKQFNWFRSPTGCASVQVACPVETTVTTCDYEVNCTKPCNCTSAQPCAVKDNAKKKNIKCMCFTIKKSKSQMSIDSTRSKSSRCKRKSRKSNKKKWKNSRHKCECMGPSGSDKSMTRLSSKSSRLSIDPMSSTHSNCKEKSRKSKSKKTSHKCECKAYGSDKGVTTYAEQGTGCATDRGQDTQTPCSNSVPIINVSKTACNSMCHRAEIWSPKPCVSKHAMSQSTVSIGQDISTSDSDTSCCTSETELE